jgi:hypothetical protein
MSMAIYLFLNLFIYLFIYYLLIIISIHLAKFLYFSREKLGNFWNFFFSSA